MYLHVYTLFGPPSPNPASGQNMFFSFVEEKAGEIIRKT
jgi:hypothetical protein